MKHCVIICSHFLFSVAHLEIKASSIQGFSTISSPFPFKEPSSVSLAEKWLPFFYSLRQFQNSLASGSDLIFWSKEISLH